MRHDLAVMEDRLPTFRYYPGAVGDGTIKASSDACAACGRARGFLVTSTAYGENVAPDAEFCPWCIADGSANSRFGAFFNEVEPGADAAATVEVTERTPNFPTWQDWSWPTHCGDVGVYRGQPSGKDLRANQAALEELRRHLAGYDWGRNEEYVRDFIDGLGGSQVAYLFECPRCGKQLLRWDMD